MSKPRRVSPRQATLPLARRSDGGAALDRAQAQRSEMDTYVQSVAGGAAGEIERAKGLERSRPALEPTQSPAAARTMHRKPMCPVDVSIVSP
jgi:hypothetical protein